MQSIGVEIHKFIKTISQREIQKNPKLKRKLIALAKSLDSIADTKEEVNPKTSGIIKYLNQKMLK